MQKPTNFITSRLSNNLYRLFKQSKLIYQEMSTKVIKDILNERSSTEFSKDLLINTAFILCCMIFTTSLNYIPRPDHIYYKFLYRFDSYFFEFNKSIIGPITGILLLLLGSLLLYGKYFRHSFVIFAGNASFMDEEETDDGYSSFTLKPLQIIPDSHHHHLKIEPRHSLSSTSISTDTSLESPPSEPELLENGGLFDFTHFNDSSTSEFIEKKTSSSSSKVSYIWNLSPILLLATSWFILNALYSTKTPIYKAKNIVAWIFHVPVHFIVPPFIGTWLYLFHPPGALKLFIFSLGLQNLVMVITYLIFPNAPPLFIKLYGENKEPTFDMIYTDGITSEDMKFSILLQKAVYYATPNKFASFPSMHSAFACLIFFFVCYYSKWSSFKLLGLINILGQWWTDLYLDHHWRIDSLAGLVYAITTWVILMKWKKYGLTQIDEKFSRAKENMNFKNGSTMGMRLFRNTRFQKYFDPLA
ncbi:uncharacterized protein J8A68_004116 [[Candida] subhashii]|uniref:Inositolphosphotransferase Aur1/Ipt1 domain-containing protein n=1 Tax=[Candida] subhashii TaxID=561895 RepID=A0A8J5UVN8_9ASCO|nr:uncharacterized protein J8A68_004116 [[Candida] subhashii]KAG7662345.1 hypothetical protein J8A68_004116 [[Candida] subhashii]